MEGRGQVRRGVGVINSEPGVGEKDGESNGNEVEMIKLQMVKNDDRKVGSKMGRLGGRMMGDLELGRVGIKESIRRWMRGTKLGGVE